MTRKERIRWGAFGLLVVLALSARWWRGGEVAPVEPWVPPPAVEVSARVELPAAGSALPPPPRATSPAQADVAATEEPAEEAEPRDAAQELRAVAEAAQRYQEEVGPLPVGGNAAITSALLGGNAAGEVFLPPDHPALGTSGLLVDPWEAALVFQPRDAGLLELRSSGPDRMFNTPDDLVLGVGAAAPPPVLPPATETPAGTAVAGETAPAGTGSGPADAPPAPAEDAPAAPAVPVE